MDMERRWSRTGNTHIVYIQFWGCSINYTDGPNTCQLTFNEVPSSLVVEVQTADDSSCRDRCHTTWQYDIENMHSLNILFCELPPVIAPCNHVMGHWYEHTKTVNQVCNPYLWSERSMLLKYMTWTNRCPFPKRKIRSPSLTPAPTKLHSSLNSFGLDSGRSMITTTSFSSLLRLNLKSSHEKTWNCQ